MTGGLRTIVFDLDGTLVDSAPDLHIAANRMLADLGRPSLALTDVRAFIGNGVPMLVERCLHATGGAGALQTRALARFRHHYDAAPAELTRPFPGALAALRALRLAGCRLGICTNKPEAPAASLLAILGMEAYFDALVGGDTLAVHKPDPAPLHHAIATLDGDPATTLFVGDSEVDAETAANAGIAFALYTRGYRKMPVERIAAAFAFESFDALGPLAGAGAAAGAGGAA